MAINPLNWGIYKNVDIYGLEMCGITNSIYTISHKAN